MAIYTLEYHFLFGRFDGPQVSTYSAESGEAQPLSGAGASPASAGPDAIAAPHSPAHPAGGRRGRAPRARSGPATPRRRYPTTPRAHAVATPRPVAATPPKGHAPPLTPRSAPSGASPVTPAPPARGVVPAPQKAPPPKASPSSPPPGFSGPITPSNLPAGKTPMAWPQATAPVVWADPGKINYGADAAKLSGATPRIAPVAAKTPAGAPPPVTPQHAAATPPGPPAPATPPGPPAPATPQRAPTTPAGPPAPATPAPPPASSRDNPFFTKENADALRASAARRGVDPLDLATVISYETERSFNPNIWGGSPWSGGEYRRGGNYMGLIQFGKPERKQYGAHEGQSFVEQLPAVEAYLKDRGFQPGMGILDLYSTINAGSPGHYNLSDDGGRHTVRTHVQQMLAGVDRQLAREFLDSGGVEARQTMTPSASLGRPVFIGDSIAHGLRGAAHGEGDTKIGRGPQAVLGSIANLPAGALAGRSVVISSGASNYPAGAGALSDQIAAAKEKGATPGRITVMGVGPRRDFAGVNERLRGIAQGAGARFQPLLETGRDLVHPKNYDALLRAVATPEPAVTTPVSAGRSTGAQAGATAAKTP
ncbi:hypothetical protein [Methylocystis bryophila]|uniref:Uncharacterized protein n=1 Tax=Methylocystis bryophila TaxID=655015 RepID=A0A1W6MW53_9HYPH|nr:hypothetical protein [Methylocystis bryophila]ARN81838.1 hypothetical protein B1812_12945 [Methylocystis bryophila]BDV37911.1 hypothetical protein DSM21852_11640 [Methylocystis bryophila]